MPDGTEPSGDVGTSPARKTRPPARRIFENGNAAIDIPLE
jgi:hypothetical protein